MKIITISGKELQVEMSIGWMGYGQYRISAQVQIENEKKDFHFHSTDSELFDKRQDDEISYNDYQEMLFASIENKLIKQIEDFVFNLETE